MLDFEQVSLTQPATLVTIVTEAVLKDSIILLLKNLKVKGYTVTEVKGEGRCPRLVPGLTEAVAEISANQPAAVEATAETSQRETSQPAAETSVKTQVEIQVETPVEVRAVVSQDLSNVILYALKEHQHHFAIVAYRQQVEAMGEY